MIPRAVDQVFRVAEDLRSKGWEYQMEGQFLEIVCANPLLATDPLIIASSITMQSTIFSESTSLTRKSMR